MRTRMPSEKDLERWIRQGYGQGDGQNYQPFFHIRDVPSQGRSRSVVGLKTGRKHCYLSDIEWFHGLYMEYHPKVTGMRDQYALLPREETIAIAKNLGIAHPTYPGTRTPTVMTTDFVMNMTGPTRISAVAAKLAKDVNPNDLETVRIREKLAIEEIYWANRGIRWTVSTEKNLPMTLLKNLDMFRQTVFLPEHNWLVPMLDTFVLVFEEVWEPYISFIEILNVISKALKISKNDAYVLVGKAIWSRLLDLDLDAYEIHYFLPLQLKRDC